MSGNSVSISFKTDLNLLLWLMLIFKVLQKKLTPLINQVLYQDSYSGNPVCTFLSLALVTTAGRQCASTWFEFESRLGATKKSSNNIITCKQVIHVGWRQFRMRLFAEFHIKPSPFILVQVFFEWILEEVNSIETEW